MGLKGGSGDGGDTPKLWSRTVCLHILAPTFEKQVPSHQALNLLELQFQHL